MRAIPPGRMANSRTVNLEAANSSVFEQLRFDVERLEVAQFRTEDVLAAIPLGSI